jgi:hypothetical protein
MSVVVTTKYLLTTVETLPNNTGSAPDATRAVTHSDYDEAFTLNATSTPPATLIAAFLLTLSSGAATIDLRALTGTNGGPVDLNGKKVQEVRIKNLGANPMVIKAGASNGHTGLIGGTTGETITANGGILMKHSANGGDTVDGTHKTWDVTGTAAQTAEVTIIAG